MSCRAIGIDRLDCLQQNTSLDNLDRETGLAVANLRTRIEFLHSVALDHTNSRNGEGALALAQNGVQFAQAIL